MVEVKLQTRYPFMQSITHHASEPGAYNYGIHRSEAELKRDAEIPFTRYAMLQMTKYTYHVINLCPGSHQNCVLSDHEGMQYRIASPEVLTPKPLRWSEAHAFIRKRIENEVKNWYTNNDIDSKE